MHCVPWLQVTLPAVHTSPGPDPVEAQQVWPAAPQVPFRQLPVMQVPPTLGQVLPEAVHTPPTQHPPEAQALPAQQACPAPPQATQALLAQARPLPQARPVQQACPAAPHDWQVPLTQAPPDWQAPSTQHLPPSGPQLNEALLVEQAERHAKP